MKHQIVRSDLSVPYGTICLATQMRSKFTFVANFSSALSPRRMGLQLPYWVKLRKSLLWLVLQGYCQGTSSVYMLFLFCSSVIAALRLRLGIQTRRGSDKWLGRRNPHRIRNHRRYVLIRQYHLSERVL